MVLKIKETVNAIGASLVEKGMVGMMCQSFLQQLPLQTPVDMPTSTQTTFVDVVTPSTQVSRMHQSKTLQDGI